MQLNISDIDQKEKGQLLKEDNPFRDPQASPDINPHDLRNFSPLEQLLAAKFLQPSESKPNFNQEYISVLERNNKIIENLADRLQGYQQVGPTPSTDFLKKKLCKIEEKLLKHEEEDRRWEEMVDLFIYNLQSSLATLPFVKHKQNAEETVYRQNNDYIAQLKTANSLMNTLTYGRFAHPQQNLLQTAIPGQNNPRNRSINIFNSSANAPHNSRVSEKFNVYTGKPQHIDNTLALLSKASTNKINPFLLNANLMLSKQEPRRRTFRNSAIRTSKMNQE